MKKYISYFLLVCVITYLSGCSIPFDVPTEGIWYCEELKIEIDFNEHEEGNVNCVKIYEEDGSYEVARCQIGYGQDLGICSTDQQTHYITGYMNYQNDILELRSFEDDITYTFIKIE